jgi:hypothetical protein
VSRGINDVDTVLGQGLVHAFPEASGGRGSDRDTTLLLLLHPVHGGRAIMNFTDFVIHACVKKHALSRGCFTGINVSRDTDIAVALNGGMASHVGSLVDLYLQTAATHKRRSVRLSIKKQPRQAY